MPRGLLELFLLKTGQTRLGVPGEVIKRKANLEAEATNLLEKSS